jgi:adenylate cyclase
MPSWPGGAATADHALLACRAALEMQDALRALQGGWQAQGFPLIAARVGLHSGPAVAGNVGSRERFNYTVMGDAVNLAARLEGASRTCSTEIILSKPRPPGEGLSGASWMWCKSGTGGSKGDCWAMPSAALQPLRSFQRPGPYMEKWQEAADRFQELLTLNPHDHPAQVFLKRCHKYLEKPPPAEWKGIFVLETK